MDLWVRLLFGYRFWVRYLWVRLLFGYGYFLGSDSGYDIFGYDCSLGTATFWVAILGTISLDTIAIRFMSAIFFKEEVLLIVKESGKLLSGSKF
uniref:Uncharacterized protein n=1 Tax=Caenorhabditis japonica TaxID=281687 RepID=A0A8R1E5R1_CAEJA